MSAKVLPALLLIALTGCVSLAPRYATPTAPVPELWTGVSSAPGATARELPWQSFYADVRLRQVQALALTNNRDLRVATLNVEKLRAAYQIQRAELLPSINAVGAGTRQRIPANLSSTGRSMVAEQDMANVGITAWELDLFGRVRSLKNRALEQYLATEEARNGAQTALLAEVANLYLTLAADREGLMLAQDTLRSHEATFGLMQKRFDVGASSELDLRRAQVGLESARAEVAATTRLVALDEHALNQLVGAPVPVELLPKGLSKVIALQDITPGLPSEVLVHRPDIQAAEHQLKAANANIGAARAAFFPRIALTTNLGHMGTDLSTLFKAGQDAWAFSPSVVLPIFDTGSRWAGLKAANADRDIFVAQYEKAIQVAFREVADALVSRRTLQEQVVAQAALVQALVQTHRLATARYDAGVDGYLSVLDAQRSLNAAQQGLIALRRAQEINLVTLYKALGGGGCSATSVPAS